MKRTWKRNIHRRWAASLLALVVVGSLAACAGGGGAAGQGLPKNAVVSKSTCDRNRSVGKITYISGYGYSSSAGQMDVFMAKQLGYFDALCLDVDINASGANGQQLVASGQAQFTALGSASDVMLSAANSKNLTAIATYGDTSPFAIVTNESVVTSLKQLEGKKLGYFINLTPVANAMLESAGADTSKIELIKMTNYDPTVVTRGQVDGIVGFASGQPQHLKALGLPYHAFLPSQFGLNTTYNVMEVNSRFLAQHRDVASDFMRADLKALSYCLDHSQACIDAMAKLAKANNQETAFPAAQLKRTWDVESQYVRDDRVGAYGVQTVREWEPEYAIVKKYGNVKNIPPLKSMMDTSLVADLYKGKTLVWPGN